MQTSNPIRPRAALGRRSFLIRSAVAAGAFSLPAVVRSRAAGANSDVRLAVLGVHGKGNAHVNDFRKIPGVRIAAVCDPDRSLLAREREEAQKLGQDLATYTDLRKLYESRDIDAVCIAMPNHWHSLAAIWACQAGKDVYVEKPVSHNIFEGRRLVEAAAKTGRIVMAGTQNRSNAGLRDAVAYVRSGQLGRIKVVRGFCYKRRASIGKVAGPQPVPPEVDYDLWCGPAPKGPLMRSKLHYDWHWVWETGNGDIGNQGIHELDLCRWFLGNVAPAPRVMCAGGRYGYDDDATTPNTQIAFFDFAEAPVVFEVRGLPAKTGMETMDHYRGIRVGLVVECENGYYAGGQGGGWIYDNDGAKVKQFPAEGTGDHDLHFIEAVRSRDAKHVTAPIECGHLSSALPHLANISYRLGVNRRPEDVREEMKGLPGAVDAFDRFREHAVANGVDLAKDQVVLGPMLAFDAKTERFGGGESGDRANGLLSREYRAPFVVPDRI
jgi:predicted dehydrogenase